MKGSLRRIIRQRHRVCCTVSYLSIQLNSWSTSRKDLEYSSGFEELARTGIGKTNADHRRSANLGHENKRNNWSGHGLIKHILLVYRSC